jgi:DNA mismatch endonuclease, patch repair protein
MTDVLTPEQRSRNMSRIRSKDTRPELALRRLLESRGIRFELHGADLPGKPDVVFRPAKKAVFVHGCYWHMHRCRYGRVVPRTNEEFWQKKRSGNVERDRRARRELRAIGWRSLIVWECWTKRSPQTVEDRIVRFLELGE